MLTALATLAFALMALGVASRAVAPAMAFLCAAAGLLALAAVITGAQSMLTLPVGLPGVPLTLALDPLSAYFLLPVCIAGTAAGLCSDRASPLLPVFAGAMLLAVLAGDRASLVLGVAAMGAATGALVGAAGLAVAGPVCLLAALALLSPSPGFAAMRATPPEGWRAACVLALTLAGAGPALLQRGASGPAGPVCALLAGGMTPVAAYGVVRVAFDLCGAATPVWWCAPLLAMGVAATVLGGVRATRATALQPVLGAIATQHSGFIAVALGVALAARGADLPALASLALGAAMLLALNQGVVAVLAALAAGAAAQGAGTQMLDRLGGLARPMPVISGTLLVAAASLAGLPLSAGFAGLWLLLQTVIAAPRIGGLGLGWALALVAAGVTLAAALAAAAALRLVGIGLLGRPRTPRAAAAEDATGRVRATLLGLAGLAALLGVAPGAALSLTAGARRALSAARLTEPAPWTGIDLGADVAGYQPLGLALLLGGVALGVWLVLRRLPAAQRVAPWEGGFAAPPPWLPFGDPATQYNAASLAASLTEGLWRTAPADAPRLPWAAALLLALALAALAAV